MRWITSGVVVLSLVVAGCGGGKKIPDKPYSAKPSSKMPGGDSGGAGAPGGGGGKGRGGFGRGGGRGGAKQQPVAAKPVAIQGGAVTLSPDTSSVSFYGGRLNSQRPGHHGGFKEFSGKIVVDAGSKQVKSISVEIKTESIWTDGGDRLNNHLKGSDFFEVKQFPTATFQSTDIKSGSDGKIDVAGKLTLHGVTKDISFSGTTKFSDDGMLLDSEFEIKRLDFGIDYGPDQLKNEVKLTVAIGKKTTPVQGGFGRRGRGRGGFGGRGKGGFGGRGKGGQAKGATDDKGGTGDNGGNK